MLSGPLRQSRLRRVCLRLDWLQRDLNQPAGDLTNGEFQKFDPTKRRHVDWNSLGFDFLHDHTLVCADGKALAKDSADRLPAADVTAVEEAGAQRVPLRVRDPW